MVGYRWFHRRYHRRSIATLVGKMTPWGRKRTIAELRESAERECTRYNSSFQEPIADGWPAWTLFQCISGPNPIDWKAKWVNAGGNIFDGYMVALKNDPIWFRISKFGLPYPPFDEYDLMATNEIERSAAERFGLISSRKIPHGKIRNWKEDRRRITRRGCPIAEFEIPPPLFDDFKPLPKETLAKLAQSQEKKEGCLTTAIFLFIMLLICAAYAMT